METKHSLPRLALLVSLFWLLRYVVAPASRFAIQLICGVLFILAAVFALLLSGLFDQEGRGRYEADSPTHA